MYLERVRDVRLILLMFGNSNDFIADIVTRSRDHFDPFICIVPPGPIKFTSVNIKTI